MFAILIIFSFCITYLIIPLIINLGHKFNFVDVPNLRKEHKKPVVRLGGLAILFTYFFLMICLKIFFNEHLFANTNNIFFVLIITNLFIFFVGLYDDLYSLSPYFRLFVQFIISIIIWLNNIKIESLQISFLDNFNIILPPLLSLIFSSIVIIGLINAINWLDGLDGLAIGITFITLISIYVLNLDLNIDFIETSLPILIGSCLAFLKYNFFPARIIMGDSGSNALGFNLSLMGIMASSEPGLNNLTFRESYSTNIDILLIIFALPIIDMTYVIFKRLLSKKSPFFPDRNHIHHRLINVGFSHKQAVLNLYLYGITNMFFLIFLDTKKIIFIILFFICLMISIFNFFIKKKESEELFHINK